MNPALNLSALTLKRGVHRDREQGVCLLEAVAWFAGEPHTDHPKCCDVALAAFGRSLNDRLRNDERQILRDLVPRLVGTAASAALAERRAYLLVDRHLRQIIPAFLRELSTPRVEWAESLESVPPIVDASSAETARVAIVRVRDEARKARDEAWAKLTLQQRAAAAAAAAAAAYAADAADAAAADAAAYAADWGEKRAQAYERMADKLIALLSEAPVDAKAVAR